jgi:hypothetical protein
MAEAAQNPAAAERRGVGLLGPRIHARLSKQQFTNQRRQKPWRMLNLTYGAPSLISHGPLPSVRAAAIDNNAMVRGRLSFKNDSIQREDD